ncbi:hypothetical protein [Propionicimonas sp.]|uniref:hypothetical protein n=1 Tax=Propionicimonas sp. TaxID=1955623 RepID=UPI0017A79FF4|nr:hypothetical protein [Propionicimonas sp.]MBU3977560.1 DUF3137 domain-containing protein [Actinomycetota bacterium]MBA3021485.1 hypothetical protein [Propionicimonas sp.]MBU3987034.1 DUF3137 domain-containing protein [Actinomycetota bacterium]MBU4008855.1 DUF3137 domain-containing protein [Actinomycetota bacterium]MBU4065995.1 DUF3137 domain-containing protein [Actinomycetota bacterium]
MSGQWVWWIAGVLGLGAAVGIGFLVRHQLYLKQLKERGWAWNSNPSLADFLNFQVPPFGLGVNRRVDDHISGTTADGRRFDCFEYAYNGGPGFNQRLLAVQLPAALPSAFAFTTQAPAGIGMGAPSLFEAQGAGLTAVAGDAGYASEVHAAVASAFSGLGEGAKTALSVDGDRVVLWPVPRDVDELAAAIESLSLAAASLGGLAATWGVQPPIPGYTFYGHPDWQFIGSDDTVLDYYPVARGGFDHDTAEMVRGLRDGIRMDAFEHHWKTTETRTVSDGQGGSRTETYTQNHVEAICVFTLPYELRTLSVNGAWSGDRVRFESDDFNDAFKVRAEDAKFASDVIHPRMMEWLLATRPASGWSIAGQMVAFEMRSHDTFAVDANEATLRGFLGRIPRFVWADLGLPVPPFLVE